MKTGIALGNFDGVHIAHRRIIEKTVLHSKKNGLKSMAYIFETHPRQVISGNFLAIMQNAVKEETIKSLGIDEVFFEKTTHEILSIEPEKFVSSCLVKRFNAAYVCAGYNYTFGNGGAGNSESLLKLCKKHGISAEIVDEVKNEGKTVSSSLIRDYIKIGETEKAAELLCAPYTIRGEVLRGKGIGKILGFKTANILPPKSILLPKNGVYETQVKLENKILNGITNIGVKPTFGGGKALVETHILDFDGDIYGKTIDILFGRRIREESKFKSPEELSRQIKKDLESLKK